MRTDAAGAAKPPFLQEAPPVGRGGETAGVILIAAS